MQVDLIPFFIGLALGLGCCITALVVVLRALLPFRKRAKELQASITALQFQQTRADIERIANAAARIESLRARVNPN